MRTTRSATNNEEEKKNSTWRRKVLGVLRVTRSHSAVCVRTEKERFQSGNARGEKESESCEATCFKWQLMLFNCNPRCVSFPGAVTLSPMTSLECVCVCGEALYVHGARAASATSAACNHTHTCALKFNDHVKHKECVCVCRTPCMCVQTKPRPTMLFLLIRGCS